MEIDKSNVLSEENYADDIRWNAPKIRSVMLRDQGKNNPS